MHTIIECTSNIAVSMLGSDDNKYRYELTRTWDEEKPKGVMIGINPSKATQLKGDNTATNAMNFFIDNNFGEMKIVNLYPYMCTKPSELRNRESSYDNINNEYIFKACEQAELILIAWGYAKDDYTNRKYEVLNLIKPFKHKIKCFEDNRGNKPQHLRILSESWKLVNFF